jgi:F0F1-type ATP synthase epsilon subunit
VESIDAQHAEEALKRARELREEKEEDLDFGQVEALIERELNRVRVARKYKR